MRTFSSMLHGRVSYSCQNSCMRTRWLMTIPIAAIAALLVMQFVRISGANPATTALPSRIRLQTPVAVPRNAIQQISHSPVPTVHSRVPGAPTVVSDKSVVTVPVPTGTSPGVINPTTVPPTAARIPTATRTPAPAPGIRRPVPSRSPHESGDATRSTRSRSVGARDG
jgi:hypothetical protein